MTIKEIMDILKVKEDPDNFKEKAQNNHKKYKEWQKQTKKEATEDDI